MGFFVLIPRTGGVAWKSRKEPKELLWVWSRFGSVIFSKAPLRFHLPVCPYMWLILLQREKLGPPRFCLYLWKPR